MTTPQSRREELLRIAADLFATRGYKNTTVRNIADAAGILSGSLYHHFDSKESMVDELLSTFQQELFAAYDEVLASAEPARAKIAAAVRLSFQALDRHRAEVAIFQNEAAHLGESPRFGYLAEHQQRSRDIWHALLAEGVASGALRPDLNVEVIHRFIRDTVWGSVNWYRPGGALTHDDLADQYLTMLLDGIAVPEGEPDA